MNEEIKEILDYFEYNVANNSIYMLKLDTNEAKILLDYMTNLQDRIDKAIEYITSEESISIFTSVNAREKWLKINHRLLNILQGDDKE